MTGFEEVERLAAPWTPERTAEVTASPPRRCARWSRPTARPQRRGALLLDRRQHGRQRRRSRSGCRRCINAVSGNLDRRGGTLVGRGVIDFPRFGVKNGVLMRNDRSRIGDFASVNDAFPGGILADEILTPGPTAGARAVRDRRQSADHDGERGALARGVRVARAAGRARHLPQRDRRRSRTTCCPARRRSSGPIFRSSFRSMLGLQSKPYLQATGRSCRPTASSATRPRSTSISPAQRRDLFGSRVAQRCCEVAKWLHSRAPAGPAAGGSAGAAALAPAARDGQWRLQAAARAAARRACAAEHRDRLPRAAAS